LGRRVTTGANPILAANRSGRCERGEPRRVRGALGFGKLAAKLFKLFGVE